MIGGLDINFAGVTPVDAFSLHYCGSDQSEDEYEYDDEYNDEYEFDDDDDQQYDSNNDDDDDFK